MGDMKYAKELDKSLENARQWIDENGYSVGATHFSLSGTILGCVFELVPKGRIDVAKPKRFTKPKASASKADAGKAEA